MQQSIGRYSKRIIARVARRSSTAIGKSRAYAALTWGAWEYGHKDSPLYLPLRRLIVGLNTRRIAGPPRISYKHDEVIVVCLARNAELYVTSFLEHYFALGVKHVVLMVNRTSDTTVERARRDPRVTILECNLSFKRFQLAMREYMANRFGRNRWVLVVDIDEHFIYPRADMLNLHDFLRYLNIGGYTAVVAQMLDMFSDQSFSMQQSQPSDRLVEKYPYYDTTRLRTRSYTDLFGTSNTLANAKIHAYFGGIRRVVFNADCFLTKHPLIFAGRGVRPMRETSHDIENAYLADVSCLLLHYKFLSNLPKQAEQAIAEGQYWQNSVEYHQYYNVLDHTPDLEIKQPTSQRLEHANDLLDQGFIVVSPAYEAWVDQAHRKLQQSQFGKMLVAFASFLGLK